MNNASAAALHQEIEQVEKLNRGRFNGLADVIEKLLARILTLEEQMASMKAEKGQT